MVRYPEALALIVALGPCSGIKQEYDVARIDGIPGSAGLIAYFLSWYARISG